MLLALTAVANFGIRQPYQLIAVSKITSLDDLVGKQLITSAASATPTLRVSNMLDREGLLEDVNIVNIAKAESQVAAFRAGQAEAVFLQVANAQKAMATVPGSHVLVDVEDIGPELVNTGLCVSNKFLEENPGTIYQLIAGLSEAVSFSQKNEEKTIEILMETFDLTEKQAKSVQKSEANSFTAYPIPHKKLWEEVARLDSLGEQKEVTVEEILAVTDFTIAKKVIDDLGLKRVADIPSS